MRLHEAILGEKLGGVGPGLTPKRALELGLKVDAELLPKIRFEALRGGSVSLEDPKTTVELLRANSVVGVTGFFEEGKLRSVGIQCALSIRQWTTRLRAVSDAGWTPGQTVIWISAPLLISLRICSRSPALCARTRRQCEGSSPPWGPGKYDAQLNIDGKGFRPDGRSAATVIPAAYGLAG